MTASPSLLEQLGFSGLESEIYIHLLGSEPSTGYHISQQLGKPRANVYQALESLYHKGAALMDEGGARMFRAVAPVELVERLQKEYARHAAHAGKVLGKIRRPADDQGVYQMKTRAQVIERARAEVSRATRIVLLDISPPILTLLTEDLKSAIGRGVTLGALLYGEQTVEGAIMHPHHRRQELRERWKGDWLNLVCDGKRVVWSLFKHTTGEPFQALCSSSPFISWIYHSALAGEIMLSAIVTAHESNATSAPLARLIREHQRLTPPDAPGALELQAMANEE